VISHFHGEPADLVVCDGAPDVTGLHDMDEYVQGQLLLAALAITTAVLKPGGTFVAKIFRGKDVSLLYTQLRVFFPEVYCAKPKASRNSSIEAFVVCLNFTPPPSYFPGLLQQMLAGAVDNACDIKDNPALRRVVPFLACGDLHGWDADQNYDLEAAGPAAAAAAATNARASYVALEPVQPPTAPAYKTAKELVQRAAQAPKAK
jgi:tRNA (cytidine32/guanosine34-2'-O)-methyltransferase